VKSFYSFPFLRFGSQIGIFKLKSYLEKVLQQKYIESVSPTLEVLENLCISTQQELNAVKRGALFHFNYSSVNLKSISFCIIIYITIINFIYIFFFCLKFIIFD
jgi:hypothetical protein